MSRQDSIINVFREMGGATTLRLAQKCIERGVFSSEELHNASVHWAQNVCREAIKQIDPITRLPFAGPTLRKSPHDGARVWHQISFMDYDNLAFNIQERASGVMADYDVLLRLRDFCHERFGQAPEIPDLGIIDPTGFDLTEAASAAVET